MFRMAGWLLVLVLATAGTLPTAAASEDAGEENDGAPGHCNAAEPVCEVVEDCEATNPNKLMGDPVGTVLGCV